MTKDLLSKLLPSEPWRVELGKVQSPPLDLLWQAGGSAFDVLRSRVCGWRPCVPRCCVFCHGFHRFSRIYLWNNPRQFVKSVAKVLVCFKNGSNFPLGARRVWFSVRIQSPERLNVNYQVPYLINDS